MQVAPRLLDGTALFLFSYAAALRFCVTTESGWGMSLSLMIHLLFWAAAAAWLAARALGPGTARLSLAHIPLGVLAVLAVASIARASYALPAIDGAVAFATFAMMVPLATALFAGRTAALANLLCASLAALAAYALLQRFWIFGVLEERVGRTLEPEVLTRLRSKEVFSTFFYPNSFAGFLVTLLPLAAGLLADARELRSRIVPALALLAGALALSMTGSLGAWVAAGAGAMTFAVVFIRRRVVTIACGIVCIAAAAVAAPRVLRHESMQIRAVYWTSASRIAGEHAVLGVGLNNFEEYYLQYRDPGTHEVKRAHNDYLQLLVELGVPGLLAYLAFVALALRAGLKPAEPSPPPDRPTSLTMAAGVTAAVLTAAVVRGVFLDVAGLAVLPLVLACWLAALLVPRPVDGPATRTGLVAGLAGVCVHSLVDFDLYDWGTAAAVFLVAALLTRGRERELLRRPAVATAATVGLLCALGLLTALPRWLAADGAREEAADAMRRRDAASAKRELEAAVRDNPLDAESWAMLARVSRFDPSFDAAFKRAIELRPRHSPYHFQRAQAHEHLARRAQDPAEARRRFEVAGAEYQQALLYYPTRAANHYALARVLDDRDLPDHAVEHYRRALELERYAETSHLRLSTPQRIRAFARTGARAEMLAVVKEALALPPSEAHAALDRLPAAMGVDLDARIRPELESAIAEVRALIPR